MRFIIDQPSADDGRNLIDAVGEQEAAVENRHARLVDGDVSSVHVSDIRHGRLRVRGAQSTAALAACPADASGSIDRAGDA